MSVASTPGPSESPLVRRDIDATEPVTEAVFEAVELTGIDVDECDENLYAVLDGDALDRLFTTGGPDVRLEFRLWDRYVVIRPTEVAVYT